MPVRCSPRVLNQDTRWQKGLLAIVLALLFGACGPLPKAAKAEEELFPPRYITVVDETGQPVASTCHVLRPGDELLTSDNRRYRIVRVEKYRAVAQFIARENLESLLGPQDRAAIARLLGQPATPQTPAGSGWLVRWSAWWHRLRGGDRSPAGATGVPAQNAARVVGIYHTHTDES